MLLNFAAIKQLPLIFICENNLLAIHTHQNQRQHVADISGMVRGYGIPSERIDTNDTASIHACVTAAAAAIRAGQGGPVFVECMTCRWKEHVGPGEDFDLGYRSAADVQEWKDIDDIKVIGDKIPTERRTQIEAEVEQEIQALKERLAQLEKRLEEKRHRSRIKQTRRSVKPDDE